MANPKLSKGLQILFWGDRPPATCEGGPASSKAAPLRAPDQKAPGIANQTLTIRETQTSNVTFMSITRFDHQIGIGVVVGHSSVRVA